jgi:hypothetical protein
MITTFEHNRPKTRPKAPAPSIREVCLVGNPTRRYVHTDLVDVGQGLPYLDREAEVGRQGKPCPTI